MKKDLKNEMLNDNQAEAVRHFIIDSMRGVYVDQGVMPGDAFMNAASNIANAIVKNVQMGLLQGAVYTKAVEKSKPVKKSIKKSIKKVTLPKKFGKIKKHARK